MATIVTRSGKGSALAHTEVDANFTNLNNDKLETNAEVRAAVEAASDSNVFTDADHTKLDAIEANATADQTAAEILTAIKTVDGTGSGLDADTLDGVEANALMPLSGGTFAGSVGVTGYLSATTAMTVQNGSGTEGVQLRYNENGGEIALYGTSGNTKLLIDYLDGTNDGNGLGRILNLGAGSTGIQLGIANSANTGGLTLTTGNNVTRQHINAIGDIYTYQTDGSTIGMTWKADNKRLGINTASPSTALDVTGTVTATAFAGDGSALTGVGGGASASADLYKANPSSATSPTASGTNAVAIGDNAVASGFASISIGKDSDSTNTNSIALGRLSQATGANGSVAIGLYADSSGDGSVAIGSRDENNTAIATGETSVALGTARATGSDSFAAAIMNNTSSYGSVGPNSVSLGSYNKASGYQAGAFGGFGNISSGNSSFATGYQSQATGDRAFASGYTTTASGSASFAHGDNVSATGARSFCQGGGSATASGEGSVAMGYAAVASNENAFALGRNTDATHSKSYAIGYGAQATANSAMAIGEAAAASVANQIALGGTSNQVKISGTYTLPTADGSANQVLTTNGSGAVSFADAGGGADLYAANESSPSAQPSATGANAIAIGDSSVATASKSVAIGHSRADGISSFAASVSHNSTSYGAIGNQSVALGQYVKAGSNGIAIGSAFAYTEGSQSVAIGRNVTAVGSGSLAMGHNSKANIIGMSAYTYGQFAAQGDSQSGHYVLKSDTTDATAEAMTTNNSTAAATNQIVAASDTCITFSGTIVAMRNGAQSYGSWEIKGLLVNDGGTTTLANSAITVIQNASSWGLALSADNTNNALKVQVTGEASHNIRWVANVQTSEVTYA